MGLGLVKLIRARVGVRARVRETWGIAGLSLGSNKEASWS